MLENVYLEGDNGFIYLHIDSGLRLIPNRATFASLFGFTFDPSMVQQFPSSANAPFSFGYPILDGSAVYTLAGNGETLFFADVLPWNQNVPALRPIVNQTQLSHLGFASSGKQWPADQSYTIGVPLAIHSGQNWHLQTFISGYHSVYNHLCHPENPINPFFARWLDNDFSKPQVKALIISTQNQIDQLKAVVPVQTPTFGPPGGSYANPILQVSLGCATQQANIYYTTDGTYPVPGVASLYAAPLQLNLGDPQTSSIVLNAVAECPDSYGTSDVATATYTFSGAADAPTISPSGGPQQSDQIMVTLTCPTPGAVIYYTLDGSTPTMSSAQYTAPFSLNLSGSEQQVQAAASAGGVGPLSAPASATYTYVPAQLTSPVFSPTLIDRVGPTVTFTLTAQAGVRILYGGLNNDATPINTYSLPVTLSLSGSSTIELTALAESDNGAKPSEISEQTYHGTFAWNNAWMLLDDSVDLISSIKLSESNVTYHSGSSGNAVSFTGNSILDTKQTSRLLSPAFSITAWAKVTAVDSSSGYSPIFVFEQESTGNDGPAIFVYSNGTVKAETIQGNGQYVTVQTAANAISFGQWCHYALVADGTNLTLYINGTSAGSASYDGTISSAYLERFCVGAERAGTPNDVIRHGMTGLINRVYYSTLALAAGQVAALYAEENGANV